MKNRYLLGRFYRDTGTPFKTEDQFMRWVNIDGSRMPNSPGIRPLAYSKIKDAELPAYVILVTANTSRLSDNPWEDKVDYENAEIKHWGDAKFDVVKGIDDWKGNKTVRKIYNRIVANNSEWFHTPFLHFSKPEKGWVVFNGLCVLDNLELTWFWDDLKKIPVQNYLMHLRILDCPEVDMEWLHQRANVNSLNDPDQDSRAPEVWKFYKAGGIKSLRVHKKEIKSLVEQIPDKNTMEFRFLENLTLYKPYDFEKIIVGLFQQFGEIVHNVKGTKPTGDGGFDFYGDFKLSSILAYRIKFRGEVKKWAVPRPVSPKDVARLVARLRRGEYGIFVTTSSYSKQTQEEVLSDGYPVKLVSGLDLVNMFKKLNLIDGGQIKTDWVITVLDQKL